MENIPTVFVSYSKHDEEIANSIKNRLIKAGIKVLSLSPFPAPIYRKIHEAISSSDYLMVILSQDSVKSRWVKYELSEALLRELNSRDITVLPILVEDCKIPTQIASRVYFDLRDDFNTRLDELIGRIRFVPDIDFSRLDAFKFEELVYDLIKMLGFTHVQRAYDKPDRGIDLQAQYLRKDAFGEQIAEIWLIVIKLYLTERPSLKTVKEFVSYISSLPVSYKGLFVTNSHFTSSVYNWLESTQRSERVEIKLLDRTDLKKLLLKDYRLIAKYF